MSFASRPDVCGNGRNNISTHGSRGGSGKNRDEWLDECEHGPVRVAMDIADGQLIAVRTYVAGRWGSSVDATDLGTVGVREAVDFLLDNAARGSGHGARDAAADQEVRLSAVCALSRRLADGVPALLAIARTSKDPAIRKQAIFWLGQSCDPRAIEVSNRC